MNPHDESTERFARLVLKRLRELTPEELAELAERATPPAVRQRMKSTPAQPEGGSMFDQQRSTQVGLDRPEGPQGEFKVSTVDTRSAEDPNTPWPFETMVFWGAGVFKDRVIYHRAHPDQETATVWHGKIVAMCTEGTLPIGEGIRGGIGHRARCKNPSLTPGQWAEGRTQGEPFDPQQHRIIASTPELARALKACGLSEDLAIRLHFALMSEGDSLLPAAWDSSAHESAHIRLWHDDHERSTCKIIDPVDGRSLSIGEAAEAMEQAMVEAAERRRQGLPDPPPR